MTRYILIIGLIVTIAILFCGVSAARGRAISEVGESDGDWEVVVYSLISLRNFLMGSPGGGTDGPGIVELRRTDSGKVIASRRVKRAAIVDDARWSSDMVEVKWVADWPLPREP